MTILRDVLLSAAFDNEEGKWVHMQNAYDFTVAKIHIDGKKIAEIKRRKHLMKKHEASHKIMKKT